MVFQYALALGRIRNVSKRARLDSAVIPIPRLANG